MDVKSAPTSLANIMVRNPGSTLGCDAKVMNGKIEQDISHFLTWTRSACFVIEVCFIAEVQLPNNAKVKASLKPGAVNISYQFRVDDHSASPFITLVGELSLLLFLRNITSVKLVIAGFLSVELYQV